MTEGFECMDSRKDGKGKERCLLEIKEKTVKEKI